jgi:hypothetical protein
MLPFRGDERCVVACHDAHGLWAPALQSAVASAVSPLRQVPLATRFGDVPSNIPRWGIPRGDEVAERIALQFAPADAVAGAALGGTANAFATPHCHVGYVAHDASDEIREELLSWAAERAAGCEPHLLVVVGKSAGGTGLLSRALSFKGSGEDALTKLSKVGCATCRLDAPAPSPEQIEEFGAKLKECVRAGLSSRVDTLLDELEEQAAAAAAAEADMETRAATAEETAEAETEAFHRYFSKKESIALLYQQAGLPSLALAVYVELEAEYDALCSDHSAVSSGPPSSLFGGIERAPPGASAAKAAALAEAAVEAAADQVLEDLLEGGARNYREVRRRTAPHTRPSVLFLACLFRISEFLDFTKTGLGPT